MVGGSPILYWDLNNVGPPTDHQLQTSPLFPNSSSNCSSTSQSSSSSSALPPYTQSSSTLQPMTSWHDSQELPESWSQLLLGGLVEEEDYRCATLQAKRIMERSWEDQQVLYPSSATSHNNMVDHKGYIFLYGQQGNEEIQARSSWSSHLILPNSSPRSSLSTTSLNSSRDQKRHHQLDLSSNQCNSTPTGSPYKKPRLLQAQSTFKVRKEKLGDRITALHQIVSPFGKTDTASVLLEAIGYIRFLQSEIEDEYLKSRGLCLVPVSFMIHAGNDNSADYWAPTFCGGFR